MKKLLTQNMSIVTGNSADDDSSDTSKRMVEQTDYNKKIKVINDAENDKRLTTTKIQTKNNNIFECSQSTRMERSG